MQLNIDTLFRGYSDDGYDYQQRTTSPTLPLKRGLNYKSVATFEIDFEESEYE